MLTLAIATLVVLVGAALLLLLWPERTADAEPPPQPPMLGGVTSPRNEWCRLNAPSWAADHLSLIVLPPALGGWGGDSAPSHWSNQAVLWVRRSIRWRGLPLRDIPWLSFG